MESGSHLWETLTWASPAEIFDALVDCASLRWLTLYHNDASLVKPFPPSTPLSVFERLCQVFDRPAPLHPELEAMNLHFLDLEGTLSSVAHSLCRQLASVLADSVRYPRFRAFTLEVTAHTDEDIGVLEERWRTLFSALEASGHVDLSVCISKQRPLF